MCSDEDDPDVPQEVLDELDELIEDDPDGGDEERKPCGEYHPLPCGLDIDCADLEDE